MPKGYDEPTSETIAIETTAEVFAVFRARHADDMEIVASFTDMSGGRMDTQYGIKRSKGPFLEAKSEWEVDEDNPSNRINYACRYWLHVVRDTCDAEDA